MDNLPELDVDMNLQEAIDAEPIALMPDVGETTGAGVEQIAGAITGEDWYEKTNLFVDTVTTIIDGIILIPNGVEGVGKEQKKVLVDAFHPIVEHYKPQPGGIAFAWAGAIAVTYAVYGPKLPEIKAGIAKKRESENVVPNDENQDVEL